MGEKIALGELAWGEPWQDVEERRQSLSSHSCTSPPKALAYPASSSSRWWSGKEGFPLSWGARDLPTQPKVLGRVTPWEAELPGTSTVHHLQMPAAVANAALRSAPSPVLRPGNSLQVWLEQHPPGACPMGMGWGKAAFSWGGLCLREIQPCVPMGANGHRGSPLQNTAWGGGVGLGQPRRTLFMSLLLPCLSFPIHKMGLMPRSSQVL